MGRECQIDFVRMTGEPFQPVTPRLLEHRAKLTEVLEPDRLEVEHEHDSTFTDRSSMKIAPVASQSAIPSALR